MNYESLKSNIKEKLVAIHNLYCEKKIDTNLKRIDLFQYCNTTDALISKKLAPFVSIATRFQGMSEAMNGATDEELYKALLEIDEELTKEIEKL